jgi:maltose alpha-D-glucosyltransferase/alpha-amylase
MPGSPILYYGDEIGMGDNIWLADRNGVRTPMQWIQDTSAGFSEAPMQSLYSSIIDDDIYGPSQVNVESQVKDKTSLWHTIRRMVMARKQHHCFGWGEFEWVDMGTNAIAAYTRTYDDESILIIQNLSDKPQEATIHQNTVDVFSGKSLPQGKLKLRPLQYRWLLVAAS